MFYVTKLQVSLTAAPQRTYYTFDIFQLIRFWSSFYNFTAIHVENDDKIDAKDNRETLCKADRNNYAMFSYFFPFARQAFRKTLRL